MWRVDWRAARLKWRPTWHEREWEWVGGDAVVKGIKKTGFVFACLFSRNEGVLRRRDLQGFSIGEEKGERRIDSPPQVPHKEAGYRWWYHLQQ